MTIDEFINEVQLIVDRLQLPPEEELLSLEDLNLNDLTNEFYVALQKVNAIKFVQGTGRVYIGKSIGNKEDVKYRLQILGECIKKIWEALERDESLSKSDILKIIRDSNEDESDYYSIIAILSSLYSVTSVGKGRTGGIKKYDKEKDTSDIQNALQEITDQSSEEEKAEHEKVLYPSVGTTLTKLGFQAQILGGLKRFHGQWNTPDVIGYRIKKFENTGGAEIEVCTIEVKWDISKHAIAETTSHQRLGHKSYLLVHKAFEEIDKDFLLDLSSRGIGLICKEGDDEHKICLPAKRNNPDKWDIDQFLGLALGKEVAALKQELAKIFFTDYFKSLLP